MPKKTRGNTSARQSRSREKDSRGRTDGRSKGSDGGPEASRLEARVVSWINVLPMPAALLLVMGFHLVLGAASALPVPHTGGDNAAYLALGKSLLEQGAYLELWDPDHLPHTKYPPVFPMVLALAMALGAKTWGAFKIVPLVCTTAAVGLSYLWARRVRNGVFALVFALVLGGGAALLYSSRWILSDPLFLALSMGCLWAFSRPAHRGDEAIPDSLDGSLAGSRIALGTALVILAYFTRSAGLPLVVAVALWLALYRRWLLLGSFAATFSIPAFLWWLRDARTGHDYLSEFWLIDPYAPDLGRASVGDLIARFATNAWRYMADFIPAGLSGLDGSMAMALGLVLTVLAVVGWWRRVRGGIELAEVFAFLYAGLILIWPAVWSGDRFALPLFPLALFYGGEALVDTARSNRRALALPLVTTAALIFLGPSMKTWYGAVQARSSCVEVARVGGPLACYGAGVRGFGALAVWAGENLPESAVVYARKPRLFYAFSNRSSVVYPFTRDPEPFFSTVVERGVSHVLRDTWDNATRAYVDPVIVSYPSRFCGVALIETGQGNSTHLLAILDGSAMEGAAGEPTNETAVIGECPGSAGSVSPGPGSRSSVIPMLAR